MQTSLNLLLAFERKIRQIEEMGFWLSGKVSPHFVAGNDGGRGGKRKEEVVP